MGFFSAKEDKELIKELTKQVEQQKAIIEALNKNYAILQDSVKVDEKKHEDVQRETNKVIEQQKKEIEDLQNKIKKKENDIDNLKDMFLKNQGNASINDTKEFVLGAGKYRGGKDVPIGCFELRLITGFGSVETNKPEDLYFRMSNDIKEQKEYGWIGSYCNLEIAENTILKISESARIKFKISKKYDFSNEIADAKSIFEKEKAIFSRELDTIKSEINILNNDLIKRYYSFSDYDGITSQECKDKLILLKQKERDLRQQGKDVSIAHLENRGKKTEENIIRQMLRTFNAECDNILLNISLKNIDIVKRKIEKSYETINKLYSVDSAGLSNNILRLKLEQATLLYTYELKYQQERDIQRAVKEQMIEEAKAQKEIEDQKRKIEKDLQHHVSEINRMMKYLQKAQLDAEKQLYMDKIKELEDKIKTLEVDKKTVLEREANAKAGFVYIISNIGSFGEGIYKIGMTRRLEPMDRIHELSSASVPFEFDVHAMIFSSDAPDLENTLHKYFADRAVNKVNPRKEFYNVDIDEIERVVKRNFNDTVQFTKIPVATEYRQSLNM